MPAREQIGNAGRTDAEQALLTQRDHEAIGRLADELLPALMAKLAASGLGEIEVRESGWKARLRKPAASAEARRSASRGVVESAVGHGHAPTRPAPAHGRGTEEHNGAGGDSGHVAATSPAVGVYHPRRDLTVGAPVRAGDKIGWVDVLGVQQDVIAPVDGVIGSSLAESGEAVEYGQELVRIEPPEPIDEFEAAGAQRPAAVVGKV
jgi:biotin carboxyl carrier protein